MKKNKNLQYILLMLVVGIWGTIAFQMCHFLEDNSPIQMSNNNLLPIFSNKLIQKDSFSIAVNYADPFLGSTFSLKKTKQRVKSKRSKYERPAPPKKTKPVASVFPKVTYQGYAINNNRVTKVRLNINQKIYTLQAHQEEQGLRLIEMYRDSIIVTWKGEQKTITRKK